MLILVLKTCDGDFYYRAAANGRLAAIRDCRDQIRRFPHIFDLSELEGEAMDAAIGNMPFAKVLPFLLEKGFIREREVWG